MSTPRVGIVVLNYRNYRDTVACVRTLERLDHPDTEIVLVDNDSGNESESVLRETFPRHTVLQSGRNGGYASGNNVGLRHAIDRGADFVVILNNDTLVEPDFVTRMVGHAATHPDAGMLGALIVDERGRLDPCSARRIPPLVEVFWNRGPGRWFGQSASLWARAYHDAFETYEKPTEVDVVSGSCLMLRASLLEEIGLLDERTFLFWEEFILAEKVKRSAYTTLLCPDVRVLHKGGRSVETTGTVAPRAYLRSLAYYLARYRGVGFLRRWLIVSGPAMFLFVDTLRGHLGLHARPK